MKYSPHRYRMLLAILLAAAIVGIAFAADDFRPDVCRALEQFDHCRTLAMRAVKNAQDLKTVHTYGRGFGLDMPESIAEDVHLEGAWLFDHLYTMDVTSASLHSYSSAKEHPNLREELDAFRGFLPEAAARTTAFYEKTQRMLRDAIAAVNEAAAAKTPFRIETQPAASYPDVPPAVRNAVGDGFELGWCIAVRPNAYLHLLKMHGYPADWMLKQAKEAGVSFIRPYDAELFDWSLVEAEPGKYDWSKIDEAARLLAQHGLGIILPLLSFSDSPPDWLRQRISDDRAVLMGSDGKPITENRRRGDAFVFSQVSAKPERNPMNMFDSEVAAAFGKYVQALVRRLREQGVRILAVELDSNLPWYGGDQATARFRKWLAKNNESIVIRVEQGPDRQRPVYRVGDGAYATVAELEQKLVAIKAAAAPETVTIDVDPKVDYGPVLQVLNSCIKVGFQNAKIDPRARWGAQFDASNAVIPDKLQTAGVADPGQKRMMIDVVRWREQEYIDYLRPQVQALREADRDLPVCTFSCEVAEANESMIGRNNERLIRELGLIPHGFSLENIWDNLRRAYSPGHYSIAFTHAGAGDAYSQYAMSGYAHDTYALFSLPHVRGFIWGEQVFYYDLRWEFTSLLGWRRFHERAQGMAPEMLNTRPAPQAALLLSDTSGKFQSFISDNVGGTYGFSTGPANCNKIGCIGWGRILDSIGLSQDMLTEDQIRAGKLAGYQMLVLPSVQALPAEVAEQIRQFVSDGGILIATSATAIHDENMEARMPGQLADVLGADFDAFTGRAAVAHSPLTSPRKDGPDGVWQQDKRYRDIGGDTMQTLFCTFKPREGAEVLEVFSGDGKPAVIRNQFGKGQAVAIGYPVGRESFLSLVYWQHYGSNWPEAPHGSVFQRGIFRWVEALLQKVQFRNEGKVIDEECPRSSTYDAAYAEGTWPRSTQRYRDYFWYRAAEPRSVELIFRRGPGSTNTYMEVFNREGAYGLHPGTLELELSSKQLTIQVNRADVSAVYDVSLGCAVPFEKKGGSITLPTMIEPSMARMLALSTDGVIRLYEGNRDHGGLTDEQVCENVIRIAAGREKPREHVLIGEKQIVEFLAERGPEGIIISAEQPTFIPAAEKLAEAIRKAFGKDARISRNAPRIGFGTAGVGHRMGNSFGMVEQPDIILGNRDLSWNVAAYGNVTGRGPDAQRQKIATTQVFPVRRNGHTARLPIMTSLSFPGPGRSAVCLVRPFGKISQDICTFPSDKERPDEEPLPTTLVIGFSDVDGLNAAADAVVKLVRKAGK